MTRGLALYFERANFPTVEPMLRLLGRERVRFVKGFDWKEETGEIPRWQPPAEWAMDAPEPSRALIEKWRGFADEIPWPELRGHWAWWGASTEVLLDSRPPNLPRKQGRDVERRPNWGFVIVPEDTDYIRGRLVARLARERGIFVIVLLAHYYDRMVSYPLVGERYGDAYLVLNETSAARLAAAGVPAHKIFAVGNRSLECPAVTPRKGQPILLCDQGQDADWIQDVVAWFAARPGHTLWVRPHPMRPRALPGATRAPTLPLSELFASVGAVIAETSATLWQATSAGLPIVIPHYRFGPLPIALPERADARVVTSRAELHGALAYLTDFSSSSLLTSASTSS